MSLPPPLTPKNFFSPFTPKMLNEKIFNNLFPIKKIVFIFVARRTLPFERDFSSRNGFLSFSQKIQPFLKKLLNYKIFSALFAIKSYVNFWCKRPPFPKKLLNVPPKQFFTFFFSENTAFFAKNRRIKNIQHLISKKNVIFIFGIR